MAPLGRVACTSLRRSLEGVLASLELYSFKTGRARARL